MRALRRGAGALALLAAMASPVVASAKPSAADRALATELFDAARALLANGKAAEACPRFAESQRLDPSPGTLLNLANCHEIEGKTASAWSEFNEALAVAEREGHAERAAFAQTHIAALASRLSRITLIFPRDLARADLLVTRDGTPLAAVALDAPMPLDPGPHTVEVRAPGFEPWRRAFHVETAERQGSASAPPLMEIVVGPLVPVRETTAPIVVVPVAAVAAPSPLRRAAPDPAPMPSARVAGLVVGLAGAAAVGVGAVFGGVAISKSAQSDARCSPRCSDEGFAMNETAKSAADVSTALFVTGAVAVVVGVVLYLTNPPAARSPAASFGRAPALRF